MAKRKKTRKPAAPAKFKVGDKVRVKHGVKDVDYPDIPLGGWAGKICKIQGQGYYDVRWSEKTLAAMHPVIKKRCERDDLHIEILDMHQEDLDPDLGEGLTMEQPSNIQTKPLDPDNQEDRIRAALGITTDDAVPPVEKATLLKYCEYLKARLTFPFPATFSDHDGKRRIARTIPVVGMSDKSPVEHGYGLVCKVKGDQEEWDVPLMLLEVSKDDPNHQVFKDYCRWFTDWGDITPDHHAHVSHEDEHEGPETPASKKVGRNDPCLCGSGKKFKKCCLNKSRQNGLFD